MSDRGEPPKPRKLRKTRSASDVDPDSAEHLSIGKRLGKLLSRATPSTSSTPPASPVISSPPSSTVTGAPQPLEATWTSATGETKAATRRLPTRSALDLPALESTAKTLATLPESESLGVAADPPKIPTPPTGSRLPSAEAILQKYRQVADPVSPSPRATASTLPLPVRPEFEHEPTFAKFPRSPRPADPKPTAADQVGDAASDSSSITARPDPSGSLQTLSASIGEHRSLISSSFPEPRHPELTQQDSPISLHSDAGSRISPFSTLRSVPPGFNLTDNPEMSTITQQRPPGAAVETDSGLAANPPKPPPVSPYKSTKDDPEDAAKVYIMPQFDLADQTVSDAALKPHPSHDTAKKIPKIKDLVGKFKRVLLDHLRRTDHTDNEVRHLYFAIVTYYNALPCDKTMRAFLRHYLQGIDNANHEDMSPMEPEILLACFSAGLYRLHPREVFIALKSQACAMVPQEDYLLHCVEPWQDCFFNDHCWHQFTPFLTDKLLKRCHEIMTVEAPTLSYPADAPLDVPDTETITEGLRVTLSQSSKRVAFVKQMHHVSLQDQDTSLEDEFYNFCDLVGFNTVALRQVSTSPDPTLDTLLYCEFPSSDFSDGEDSIELAEIQTRNRQSLEARAQRHVKLQGPDMTLTVDGTRQSLGFATTRDGRQLPFPKTPHSISQSYNRPATRLAPSMGYREAIGPRITTMAEGRGDGSSDPPPSPSSHGSGSRKDRRRDSSYNRDNREKGSRHSGHRSHRSGGGGGDDDPPDSHGGGNSSDSDGRRPGKDGESEGTEEEACYIHGGRRQWENLSPELRQKEMVDIRRRRRTRQHDRNKHVREPSKIKGDDPKAVEPWLIQCGAYLKAKYISLKDGERVCSALSLFTDDAEIIHWLNAYQPKYVNWDKFTGDFWTQFGDTTITVRAKLQFHTKNLSQQTGETFPKFLKRMTMLRIRCLYQEDNVIFIDRFYYSLHPELRKMVPEPDSHSKFSTLVQACEQVCHRIPAIQEGYRGWTNPRSNNPGNPGAQRNDGNRRPQQYIPNRRLAVPAAPQPRNRPSVPTIRVTPSMDGIPIEFQGDIRDPAVKALLAEHHRCYNCRKEGHTSNKCPDNPNAMQPNFYRNPPPAPPRYNYASADQEVEEIADEDYFNQPCEDHEQTPTIGTGEEYPDLDPADDTASTSGKS